MNDAKEFDDFVQALKGTKNELTHEQLMFECMLRAWQAIKVLAAGEEIVPLSLSIKGIIAAPGKDSQDAMQNVSAIIERFHEAFPMNNTYITVGVPGKNSKSLKQWKVMIEAND